MQPEPYRTHQFRQAPLQPEPRFRISRIIPLVLAGIVLAYVLTAALWPLQAAQATESPVPQLAVAAPTLTWPTQGQSAVGAADYGVLASSSPTETPVPMASITKLVTVLNVLKVKPLNGTDTGPTITFTQHDADIYNAYIAKEGSVAPADPGLQLSERQLIQIMLTVSANNYADTLAAWAYGSVENEVAAANQFLKEQGLTDTVVADASGFSPSSKSTASNLVQLGSLVLKNSALAEAVALPSVTFPGGTKQDNTNALIGTDGIVGIKTGTTDEAGTCLLFAANTVVNNQKITVIGAVLGEPTHTLLFRDVLTLLDSAKTGFAQATLVKAGQVFATYRTPWGQTAKAVASSDQTAVLWKGQTIAHTVAIKTLKPQKQGAAAGSVKATAAGKTYTTKLVLDKPLKGPSLGWRIFHPGKLFAHF